MRFPYVISEDALMVFVMAVALVAVTVAFVAYVGTWISARRHQRGTVTDAPSALPGRRDNGTREIVGALQRELRP
ncbi:MAG: hypothetical protein ABWY96_04000 [Gaiellaceae bacterium]|jgi:hypothetical protein